MDACGKAGELNFAVGIGTCLEIEPADSSESVGDMNLDDGGIGRFAVYAIHDQFQGARPGSSIHHGDLLLCSWGWWSLTSELQPGQREKTGENQHRCQKSRSAHLGMIIRRARCSPRILAAICERKRPWPPPESMPT